MSHKLSQHVLWELGHQPSDVGPTFKRHLAFLSQLIEHTHQGSHSEGKSFESGCHSYGCWGPPLGLQCALMPAGGVAHIALLERPLCLYRDG